MRKAVALLSLLAMSVSGAAFGQTLLCGTGPAAACREVGGRQPTIPAPAVRGGSTSSGTAVRLPVQGAPSQRSVPSGARSRTSPVSVPSFYVPVAPSVVSPTTRAAGSSGRLSNTLAGMDFDELPDKPKAVLNAGRVVSRSLDQTLAKLESQRDTAAFLMRALEDPKEELRSQLLGLRDDIRDILITSSLKEVIARKFGGEAANNPDVRSLSEAAAEIIQTAPWNSRGRVGGIREVMAEKWKNWSDTGAFNPIRDF